MNKMKRFLSLILIICLVSLSLVPYVAAGECVSYIDEEHYSNTIRPNDMVPYIIMGYISLRSNGSSVSYYNATVMDAYAYIRTNGSIYVEVYRTRLNNNISSIAFELMGEWDFIVNPAAQPGDEVRISIALPYLNGHTIYDNNVYGWVPSIVLFISGLENYTIQLEMTTIAYWDVYFEGDDIPIIDGTETVNTTEQLDNETETSTTTTSNVIVGGNPISIWTIVMGAAVTGECVMIAMLGRLIMRKRREIYGEI